MLDWLIKLKAPKFYRYWFYRQYMFTKGLGEEDIVDASMTGSAMTMAFHFSALLFLSTFFWSKELNSALFSGKGPLEIIIVALLFLALSYFLFSYRGKFKNILKEFENEKEIHKKWGWLYTLIYLIFSLLGIFPIIFWITGLL